jgi:O-antigen ligase/tetratricopeptide (TPR) repeat protein
VQSEINGIKMKLNGTTEENLAQILSWRGQWLGRLCLGTLVFFTWLPDSYYLMISWPWILIWEIGFLLSLLWAIWMLRQLSIPFKPLGYGLDWALGIGAIALIISSSLAEFPQMAWYNSSRVVCYGILLYVLRNWLGQSLLTITLLWRGLSLVGIVTSAIGLIIWSQNVGESRNAWPLGHPNFVAGYALLVFPVIVALAWAEKGWRRLALLGGSVLVLLLLYGTSSRGGFLGFLTVALITIGYWIFQKRGRQRWIRLAISLLLLSAISLSLLKNPRVQQLIKVPGVAGETQQIEVRLDDESQQRLYLWRGAWNMFKHNPLFGVGPGNMSRVYNLYRSIEAGSGFAHSQQLHNTYLQIVGELGLLGLSAVIIFFVQLGYLWYRLTRILSEPRQQYLLYAIAASLLGYGVSVLTDYQLENIPLSSTIVVLVVLLLGLAPSVQPIPSVTRRCLSLVVLAIAAWVWLTWLPVSIANYLSSESVKKFEAGELTESYKLLLPATVLVPWEPTYSLLVGFELMKVRELFRNQPDNQQMINTLTKEMVNNFSAGLKAAPYDVFFNHNLGAIYQELGETKKASYYFGRAVQLQPRIESYTYFLLAEEYLKQKDSKKAVDALVIQGIVNPKFLFFYLWNQPEFSIYKNPVFSQTINHLETLLKRVPPNDPYYNSLYQNIMLLKWWSGKPLKNVEWTRLTPIAESILEADVNPQKSLKIVEKALEKDPKNIGLIWLRNWLKPEQYLAPYLKNKSLNEAEKKAIIQNIDKNRNLRYWLQSITETQNLSRGSLVLAYRNPKVDLVAGVLIPTEIQTNLLVNILNLFSEYPNFFPPLDQMIVELRTKNLNLANPIYNQFKLEKN